MNETKTLLNPFEIQVVVFFKNSMPPYYSNLSVFKEKWLVEDADCLLGFGSLVKKRLIEVKTYSS